MYSTNDPSDTLLLGDNLFVILALLQGSPTQASLRGKIDLIYIDPPFDSKADYKSKIALPDSTITKTPAILEQFAYSDTWHKGTISYLQMLTPRLMLMRELLSDKGSIYIHCDWHCGHYIKVLCDAIFGRENFRNEIVWQRDAVGKGAKKTSQQFSRELETIFFYTKTEKTIFYQPYRAELTHTQLKEFRYKESSGRLYKIVNLGDYSQESITKMETENLIHTTSTGKKYKKYYLDEFELAIGSLWNDIPNLSHGKNPERTGYATQKPEALLERIIKASSDEGSIVADFFMGSGTTLAVAHKLGRKFIGSDIGKPAFSIARKRLLDIGAEFRVVSVGEYNKNVRNVGELAEIVIALYADDNGELARQSERKNIAILESTRTLLYVDSPNAITGEAVLRKCEELRKGFMGREWERVIVLGWNFSLSINELLKSYANIQAQVIPPDLLERLKRHTSYKDLIGKVRFSSLQYLSLKPLEILPSHNDNNMVRVKIALDNYVLLSANALPIDKEADKQKIIEIMNSNPLSLIEYWSVDTHYDREVFRSVWQDFRSGRAQDKHRGEQVLSVLEEIELEIPKAATYRVCVKSVDVFGYEAMAVLEMNENSE